MLTAIEHRHPGKAIEVEVLDDAGYPATDFSIKTEYIIPCGRATVRLCPPSKEPTNDRT